MSDIEATLDKLISKANSANSNPVNLESSLEDVLADLNDLANDYELLHQDIEELRDEVMEELKPHLSILADDEDYSDPTMWWAIPLRNRLNEAMEELSSVISEVEVMISDVESCISINDSPNLLTYCYEIDDVISLLEKARKDFNS